MNKFRIITEYDEFIKCICLKCKNEFTCASHPITEGWRYCPICMTEWDGEFNKRNKKYKPKDTYDWRNPGYKVDKNGEFCYSDKPRLIIEKRTYTDKSLSPNCFSVILHSPKFTTWHLCSHTTLVWGEDYPRKESAAVNMFNSFNSIKPKEDEEYRLRLLNKEESRVIKIKSIEG